MTRGELILITNKNIICSIEFNGDMYVKAYETDGEITLSPGADALKRLKKVKDEKEFLECLEEINQGYGYEDKLSYNAHCVPDDYDPHEPRFQGRTPFDYDYCKEKGKYGSTILNFISDKKNNISFYSSDYHYIKNVSDEDVYIRYYEGVYILKPGQVAADNFWHVFNNTAPKFVSEYDHKTYHYGATKAELKECKITLPRLSKYE